MHSQHKDWQIAQSRDCFCDFGRKLVNLRLPAYFTVMFCHGWQNKAASSHGGLVVAVHVTLPQSNPGRLRFSYFRTTEQNRHGFVQFVNQKSCMHYLTPTSYMYDITRGLPQKREVRIGLLLPLLVNIVVVIVFMPQLEYRKGTFTNYSMGISAYTCFVMVAVYVLAASGIFIHSWKSLDRHKQIAISTYLLVTIGVTAYQMFFPEALLTSLVSAVVIVGIYLNQETPLYAKLQKNNEEMVMGVATLVENRDDNTGGHIRRTTAYVKLLAEELRSRGFYKEQLTNDYVANLVMAAPMHDVGKIAIPDAILQKPGKLTDEEFEIMKTHAQKGVKIIRETFGHLGNDAYEEMAYEVAAHHHEKWNGRGYPDGLKETEIPLCARIMAVADVFDAVSAKRCYRDAMPLDQCFHIIVEGRGRDFDPVLVDVFIEIENKIRKVYEESKTE